MSKVDDLREIFSAARDMGTAWQNELIALHARIKQLEEENKNLSEKLGTLQHNFETLSESFGQLNTNLTTLPGGVADKISDKIQASETFQNAVKDDLSNILKCLGKDSIVENSNSRMENMQDSTEEPEGPSYAE